MEGAGVHKRAVRPQSFLRSSKARTLNHREIASLNDEQAFERFKAIRFAANQGEPFCPYCGCVAIYTYKSRPIFKCQGCEKQFSLTSGTAFAHRKMSISNILYAIAEFIEGTKGVSAMYLQRKLGCEYKTAWVLAHKLREAMSRDIDQSPLSGTVEIDGTFIGGYLKPKNARKQKAGAAERKNPYRIPYLGKKKRVVVVARERGGRIRTTIVDAEADAKPFLRLALSRKATLHADQTSAFNDLVWHVERMYRVNHSEVFWTPESHTNNAENFFSMLKRGVAGVYHHIANPKYAHAYAEEAAWRLTHKGISNTEKFGALVRAATKKQLSKFKGTWQRQGAAQCLN